MFFYVHPFFHIISLTIFVWYFIEYAVIIETDNLCAIHCLGKELFYGNYVRDTRYLFHFSRSSSNTERQLWLLWHDIASQFSHTCYDFVVLETKNCLEMGKIFLDHIGGTRLFSCASCDVNLTNRSELISTRFTGATGTYIL